MRIVAGTWRGRTLVAPPGVSTRPTADRVRQALFDMLMHAEWGGRGVIEGAVVLDVFAGTGALGLEALSRGAASACFIESDAAALRALRANVVACQAEDRVEIVAGDVLRVMRDAAGISPCHGRVRPGHPRLAEADRPRSANGAASLIFLDPPYGQSLVPRAIDRLCDVGRIRPGALIVAEIGRDETWVPEQPVLAERQHGAARVLIFRSSL
jgi:16S rRNA (guanine966-N2)-methyltransferase